MEPLALLTAAGAFLAAEVAKKVGGEVVSLAYDNLKWLLKRHLGHSPEPGDFDAKTLQSKNLIADQAFVEQARAVVNRSAALRRAELVKRVLNGAALLWVDDNPGNNAYEQRVMTALGIKVDIARSTAEATAKVGRAAYDLILSDMARSTPTSGLQLLQRLRENGSKTELVFYVGKVDPSRPTPLGAFGIACQPEELLHLVFDVLERGRV
jgi:CheY-like chemotaxis protein